MGGVQMTQQSIAELREEIRQDPRLLEDYLTLLRFPTVSADPQRAEDLIRCARWLEARLQQIGLEVLWIETPGAPVLLAQTKQDPKLPTLLIYNHYDVQPVDPVSAWDHPPFDPLIREGVVYARGAQDNKGQLAYVLAALRTMLPRGDLPCNIKWIIEGEEEHGSAGLAAVLSDLGPLIQADDCLIVDGSVHDLKHPAVDVRARGIVSGTLTLTGSKSDMHSGALGGLAYNPLRALCEIISSLWDEKGRVTVPGFYDNVEEWSDEQKALVHAHAATAGLEELLGLEFHGGEKDLPPWERVWLRPTLEINGLSGGHSGPGHKTVIPAVAEAKITCRLVAGQDPRRIAQCLKDTFASTHVPGMKIHWEPGHGGHPLVGNPEGILTEAARAAYEEVFGVPCGLAMTGGSYPVCADLVRVAGAGVLSIGLGLPTDQIHAPNEHFDVDRLTWGVVLIQKVLQQYGERQSIRRVASR